MLTLPNAIVPVLHPFATLFRNPTWLKAQILLVGAILAPGQRTVASALRVMGFSDHRNYARYHQGLNRAVWSPRQAARILLVLLLQHLDQGDGPLIFGIDETLERRRGPKIKSLGIYRDGVRSSRSQVVKASDLRWISLMWLGALPQQNRYPTQVVASNDMLPKIGEAIAWEEASARWQSRNCWRRSETVTELHPSGRKAGSWTSSSR